MLLDHLLLGISIDQAGKGSDDTHAAPSNLAVLRRLHVVDAGEGPADHLELERSAVQLVDLAEQVAQSQSLEGEDAVLVQLDPIGLLLQRDAPELAE